MSDNLETLPMTPNGQNFVCISFLSDKDNKDNTTGIRIGGCYEKYEEACEKAKEIQSYDQYHHVFVGEVGKWMPYNPDPNSECVKNSEYANEKLNEIMSGHKDNMDKAKVFHEIRKNEKLKENVADNLKLKMKAKEDLTNKLSKVKNIDEAQTVTKGLESIEEQIKEMESKIKDYESSNVKLNDSIETSGKKNSNEEQEQVQ